MSILNILINGMHVNFPENKVPFHPFPSTVAILKNKLHLRLISVLNNQLSTADISIDEVGYNSCLSLVILFVK